MVKGLKNIQVKIVFFCLIGLLLVGGVACQSEAKRQAELEKKEALEATNQKQLEQAEKAKRQAAERQKEEEAKRLEAEKQAAEAERLRQAPKSPLSGLPISEVAAKRRPVGIMISNIKAATPHSGIEQADIVYETLAEGGITRLFALFHDFDAKKIGPIRSARHYFLDFALEHDAIYIHVGQSPQAAESIRRLKVPNLNGISYLSGVMFELDKKRKRPHNTYTSFDKILKGWESKNYRQTSKENQTTKFQFSQDEEVKLLKGQQVDKLYLDLSYLDTPWFDYDETSKQYARFQFKKPQIDVETGHQLMFTNVIVQYTKIWQIPGDNALRRDMQLIGQGEGMFLTRGRMIPITWKKKGHNQPTIYYNQAGQAIKLNPGKTWVCIFPTNRVDKIRLEK